MRTGTVAAGLLLLLGGTACGGGGADEAGGGVVLTMLAAVPDTEANRSFVIVGDHTALAEAVGREWPPAGTGADGHKDAVGSFYSAIVDSDLVPPVGMGRTLPEAVAWRSEFGFSALDANADVIAGAPPEELTGFRSSGDGAAELMVFRSPGDEVADAIADAVESDPVWSDDLSAEDHAGATLYTWADPLAAQVDRTSGARRLGQGGALGVTDGWVVRAIDPEVARAALDTLADADDAPSLADNDTYAALARALDEQQAYSATLSDRIVTLDPASVAAALGSASTPERVAEVLDTTPTLPPYTAFGAGEAVADDGTPVRVLAFATSNRDQAAETIERFTVIVNEGMAWGMGRSWAETISIRSSAFTDDAVAVIIIETSNRYTAVDLAIRWDTLLVAEP